MQQLFQSLYWICHWGSLHYQKSWQFTNTALCKIKTVRTCESHDPEYFTPGVCLFSYWSQHAWVAPLSGDWGISVLYFQHQNEGHCPGPYPADALEWPLVMGVRWIDNTYHAVRAQTVRRVCLNLSIVFFYGAECQELLDLYSWVQPPIKFLLHYFGDP